MLSSNLSVNVGSPDSLGWNSRRRQKFRHKLSEVPTPTWTTKAVPNLTLQINNLTTSLPSGLVKMLSHSLDAEYLQTIDRVQTLKWKFGRERDKQIQVISSNHNNNNKHAGHKDLSRGLATPQRSSYVLIVEVTTKVGVSSTSLPLSKRPQRSLELSTKKSRVIQTSQGSSTRWKLLGNA